MTIVEQYTYDFPGYALSALFNGDTSGMDQEDIDNFNAFMEKESYITDWQITDQDADPYFTPRPEFGLSCDCVGVTGFIVEYVLCEVEPAEYRGNDYGDDEPFA